MQCVNCGFENMPGLVECVRCQSSLQLAAVDVEPPRASRHWSVNRWRRMRNGLIERFRRARWSPYVNRALLAGPSAVIVIPGLDLVRHRYRLLGISVIVTWIVCLVMALVHGGKESGQWWLAFAVMLHTGVIVHAIRGSRVRSLVTPSLGLAVFIVLRVLVYAPIGILLEQFYRGFPVTNIAHTRLIRDGDVLMYRGPWLADRPMQRGDLVIYRTQEQYRGHFRIAAGYGLDRILAMPGEHMEVKKGVLLVNGKPLSVPYAPLGSWLPLDGFSASAGSDEYIIFPSSLEIFGNRQLRDELMGRMSHVKRADVVGRVVFRTHPWSRWGRVE